MEDSGKSTDSIYQLHVPMDFQSIIYSVIIIQNDKFWEAFRKAFST